MNTNLTIEKPYPQAHRRMETGPLTPPQSPPTLEEIHRGLRDAVEGIYSNNTALSALNDRLFGDEPATNTVEACMEPAGEIGSIMATTRTLCEMLRKQRAIIDRLIAI